MIASALLFAITSGAMLWLQTLNSGPKLTAAALYDVQPAPEPLNDTDPNDSDSGIDIESPQPSESPRIPGQGIPRSESEFSLGLNRSTSVAETMNQLGLCDTGHTAIFIARIVLYSSMLVCAARYLTAGSGRRAGPGDRPPR